jgi:excisionase family DNA binding protein
MTRASEYIRAAEIAALTGMSLRTIRRWIAEEILPSTKLGGARLVAATDLKAALSQPQEANEDISNETEEFGEESNESRSIGKA